MNHIVKRRARLEDYVQIGALLEANSAEWKPMWTAKRTANQIDLFSKGMLDAFVLVDKKLNKIVGYISYSVDETYFSKYIAKHKLARYLIPGNFVCGIHQVIMVDPLYRKMGLGAKLTKTMMHDMKRKGADFLYYIRHEKNLSGKILDAISGVKMIAIFIDPWRGESYMKTRFLVKGISGSANKLVKTLEKANILQYPLSKNEQKKVEKKLTNKN
ncbi:MAG: GNAT family N-acetyltransferase [Candidatus Diapherotrites archaeon]